MTTARLAMQSVCRKGVARWLALGSGLTALLLCVTPAAGSTGYLARPEVRSFMEILYTEHGLELGELERILGEARYQPSVIRLLGPKQPQSIPAPVRSYPAYRARFLTSARVSAGAHYWDVHDRYLRRAEAEFGVPAEVILGILGVETAFGQNTGSFRVVDALATIAFDGVRRQEYFRDELKELLLLARELGIDALAIKGSYAGALGLPQFMPSSYRRYAVDYDEDGVVDLVGSAADAIGSIGSYLRAYGWRPGETLTVQVRLPAGAEGSLISGLERVHEVAALREKGVTFADSGVPDALCSIVELPTPGKPSTYLAGFANFEAITRYNRSTFYATAVVELAEAIRAARTRQITASAR
jgi:membrane-bound lytic murein transglycosylase B